MARVLVAYYSRSGNTREMADHVAEGVREAGGRVDVRPVTDVSVDDLLEYEGIIIGSPTYYGVMSAEVKKLFDKSFEHHGGLSGKVGGAFATAANIGGGNETTLLSILEAMLIHGMIVEGATEGDHYGPVSIGGPDGSVVRQCRALGARVYRLADRLF
jgi:NAD(P)H dehydrogenase (quinone)